jgi:hypothetical protein
MTTHTHTHARTHTHTHTKERERERVKGHGHSLYTDNFFSSPDLPDDLTKQKINCCGTVQTKRKGMPHDMTKQTAETWQQSVQDKR